MDGLRGYIYEVVDGIYFDNAQVVKDWFHKSSRVTLLSCQRLSMDPS